MAAYYNEIDKKKCAWLSELIKAGAIPEGAVDNRSIDDVGPVIADEAHFFAGIGVWARALRQARWPDGIRVWTGSCPCQSFSASGQRRGFSDQRHLWPAWFRLIRECRPDVLFGEQVASPDGLAWFDVVSTDLEGAGYVVGACDTCAAGFGAPHIRQRLYFVAYAKGSQALARFRQVRSRTGQDQAHRSGNGDASGRVADADGRHAGAERLQRSGQHGRRSQDGGAGGSVGDTAGARPLPGAHRRIPPEKGGPRPRHAEPEHAGQLGDASGRGLGMRGSAPRQAGRPALTDATCDMGHADRERRQQDTGSASGDEGTDGWQPHGDHLAAGASETDGLEIADQLQSEQSARPRPGPDDSGSARPRSESAGPGDDGDGLDVSGSTRSQGHAGHVDRARRDQTTARPVAAPGTLNGFWADHEWIWCRDGKYRPAKPGIFPLVNGTVGRVGLLRGYGDAIVLPQAQAFIEVFLEEMKER